MPTVADLVVRYIERVASRKRSAPNEIATLKAFLRHPIASLPADEVCSSHFAAYRDDRLQRVKPGTVVREFGILKHLFAIAEQEWGLQIDDNPLKGVRNPKVSAARDRRLTEEEWTRLRQSFAKCRNPLIEPIANFAVETAMRRGEMLSLRWLDVDLPSGVLRVRTSKNGHPRDIPLTPKAIRILESLGRGEERVFGLTEESLKLAWKRTVVRAGIHNFRFHDLRHEAISRLFELGLAMPEVALISGHRDPRMLFRYTHLKADLLSQKLRGLLG